jgi:hypothetical protein
MCIDIRRPDSAAEHRFDGDRLAERSAQQRRYFADELVEVRRLRFKRLAPGKRKELLRQYGRTPRAFHRIVDELLQTRVIRRQPPIEEIKAAGHDRHQIVEIVREAAGQPADGFHLLRLA